MRTLSLVTLALLAALTACSQKVAHDEANKDEAAQTTNVNKGDGQKVVKVDAGKTEDKALLLVNEDLLTVEAGQLASGPVITGVLLPEKRADLHAEVSAIVLQTLHDNGDKVKKGDLLVRLDDTSIRENLGSAEEAGRAAAQAFEQAQRQLDRLQKLSASGAVSTQTLEDTEVRRNATQSDLAAAKARVAQARQQLEKTEVRAPFDGVVSERAVSAGDTAQIGKQLLMVLDPSSMRFEGFIAADQMAEVIPGNTVEFRVNGYPDQDFFGKVQRVNPTVSQSTRQVQVLVSIDRAAMPMVSGLFAEGHVQTNAKSAVVLPEQSIVREGDAAFVWQIKDGSLVKTAIQLGTRDDRHGVWEIRGGLAQGVQLLRIPQGALKEGIHVEMQQKAVAKAGN